MKQYLNSQGVAYLWSKIKKYNFEVLTYQTGTVEEWNEDKNLLSSKDVLYIYSDYKTTENENGDEVYLPGLKWGDGKTYLIDLPFLNSGAVDDAILDHINNKVIHVSLQDREFWNNKLNLSLSPESQTLVLNRY